MTISVGKWPERDSTRDGEHTCPSKPRDIAAVDESDRWAASLEVDGQPALQLVRAHAQDLHALLEGDVWVVVLVEDREAVIPRVRQRAASTIEMR
jgi:hypothetical protein